jgi:hypothetical protein
MPFGGRAGEYLTKILKNFAMSCTFFLTELALPDILNTRLVMGGGNSLSEHPLRTPKRMPCRATQELPESFLDCALLRDIEAI